MATYIGDIRYKNFCKVCKYPVNAETAHQSKDKNNGKVYCIKHNPQLEEIMKKYKKTANNLGMGK